MIELKNCFSIEDAMDQADIGFIAEPVPLMTADGQSIESHKAIRRIGGKILGICGDKYQIVQNYQAFAIMSILAEKYKGTFKFAGAIGGGRIVILQMKIGNNFDVRHGDTHEKYISCINSFNGSKAVSLYIGVRRLFCFNQLRLAWQERELSVSIRHTESAEENIKEAFKIFSVAGRCFQDYREKSEQLCRKMVTKAMVQKFLDQTIGEAESVRKQNQRDKVEELFTYGKGNGRGSAFDLAHGYLEYCDHFQTENEESKLIGATAKLKEKAWAVALTL
jgi:phage/plasmid-like protein (TIGR03299 family)